MSFDVDDYFPDGDSDDGGYGTGLFDQIFDPKNIQVGLTILQQTFTNIVNGVLQTAADALGVGSFFSIFSNAKTLSDAYSAVINDSLQVFETGATNLANGTLNAASYDQEVNGLLRKDLTTFENAALEATASTPGVPPLATQIIQSVEITATVGVTTNGWDTRDAYLDGQAIATDQAANQLSYYNGGNVNLIISDNALSRIAVSTGENIIVGGNTISVGSGNNYVEAADGGDNVSLGVGSGNFIRGGDGNNTISLGASGVTYDIASGTETGAASNTIIGFENVTVSGNSTVIGDSSNNTITTGSGQNLISGGAGDDTFVAQIIASNSFDGGGGHNTYVINALSSQFRIIRFPGDTEVLNLNTNQGDVLVNVQTVKFSDLTVAIGTTAPLDANGDGMSDLLWQNSNGQAAIWTMNGSIPIGGGLVGSNPGASWRPAATGDFDGNGMADLAWQSTDGTIAVWLMNGASVTGGALVGTPGSSWHLVGSGDFDGNSKSDLLLQNTNGQAAIWLMNGATTTSGALVGSNPGSTWQIKGTGDFNGDGKSDILWQSSDGTVAIWEMNGTSVIGGGVVNNPGPSWHVIGTGDFDGDGKSDILLQNASGQAAIWLMNGTTSTGGALIGSNPGTSWHAIGTGDYNGDGKADILWQNNDGTPAVWLMNGTSVSGGGLVGSNPGISWHLIAGTG